MRFACLFKALAGRNADFATFDAASECATSGCIVYSIFSTIDANDTRVDMVRNVSATGAATEAANLAEIPDSFKLVMEIETAARQCAVVWRKKTQIGVEFR